MNTPRILLPLAVTGMVLLAVFATAAVVNAVADVPPRVEAADLFAVAPLSATMRAKLVGAEVDAMFDVGSMSLPKQLQPTRAEFEAAALQQAEVDAMFAVAPLSSPRQAAPARDPQSERGREVYLGLCFACHLPDGRGVANVFPPLAGSDFLLADRDRAIRIVLKGLIGPVTVNGFTFNSAMPPLETSLTEQQIAEVLTYVTGAWGNPGVTFTVDDVRRVKNEVRKFADLPSPAP